jgi:hypothetical protein
VDPHTWDHALIGRNGRDAGVVGAKNKRIWVRLDRRDIGGGMSGRNIFEIDWGWDKAELQIGPHVFAVSQVLDLDDFGSCNLSTCAIKIRSTPANSMRLDSLIHEVIEASNFTRELGLPHPAIQSLATDLAQAILSLRTDARADARADARTDARANKGHKR